MEFAVAWDEAVKWGIEALEDEATRRAFEGVRRPVFQRGALVGYVREYSDSLLMFKLKGEKPDKYRDRSSVDTSGPNGEPPQIIVNFTKPDAS